MMRANKRAEAAARKFQQDHAIPGCTIITDGSVPIGALTPAQQVWARKLWEDARKQGIKWGN